MSNASTIFVGSSRFESGDEQQGAADATPVIVSSEPASASTAIPAATVTRLAKISPGIERRPVRHELPRPHPAALYQRLLCGYRDRNEPDGITIGRRDANTDGGGAEHRDTNEGLDPDFDVHNHANADSFTDIHASITALTNAASTTDASSSANTDPDVLCWCELQSVGLQCCAWQSHHRAADGVVQVLRV